MKKEGIILSFIAVIIGIIVAGGAFYLYQSTKEIPKDKIKSITLAQTPTIPLPSPKPSVLLAVDTPKNEDIIQTKTVSITGKTDPDAIIVISTTATDTVISPAANGSFSTTATIQDGVNQIEITAISPTGNETKIERVITYSTETF